MLLRKRLDLLLQLSSTIKTEPQFQDQDKVYTIDCLGHQTGKKWKLVKQVVKDVFQTLDVGCGQIKAHREFRNLSNIPCLLSREKEWVAIGRGGLKDILPTMGVSLMMTRRVARDVIRSFL
ncbi:uncharacterized protein LOC131064935 isoform X2 [Cryptomeria japonica]|uniref:uncharacterized protein LOC131064935 isoform X2 n=1 Tax=Cryptomeria japonica TaxID=3369 RepID=UPI0027D9F943|nr:uncharacterized protein LOC131064935 isoform X2 [Cryptomeria japonica]